MTRVYQRPSTMTEAYQQCQHLVKGIVIRYLQHYGGEQEEIQSRANLAFTDAYLRYDPSRGSFGQRVNGVVWNVLLEGRRRDARHNGGRFSEAVPLEQIPNPTQFDLTEFIDDLSPDAQYVVRLALEVSMSQNRQAPLSTLITTLGNQGWRGDRIVATIRQIREALAA